MKALVTGATGLIGHYVARQLVEAGEEVRLMVRSTSDTRGIDGLEAERVIGDLRDKGSLLAALDGCDTLFQLASIFDFRLGADEMAESNVSGIRNILDAALERGVGKVVFTSTAGAAASGTLENPSDETAAYDLEGVGGNYYGTKREAELLALDYVKRGLPLVIVNPGYTIGPGDYKPTPSGETIVQFLKRLMPFHFDIGVSIVHAEDVAHGHILAAQKGRVGERYLLTGENMMMIDLRKLVEEVAGSHLPTIRMNPSVAIFFARVVEFVCRKILRVKPLFTKSMAEIGLKSYCNDCSKAQEELGYTYRPARRTLEETIRWFRENGYV